MDQKLVDRFIKELDARIALLEADYASTKKIYDLGHFLREHFSNEKDLYRAMINLAKARCSQKGEVFNEEQPVEQTAQECYEILSFFEPNTSITYDSLREALFTCNLANNNEVMKKYGRYGKAIELLGVVKQLFVRQQFRVAENSLIKVQLKEQEIKKFKNLQKFINTGELESELESVFEYHIDRADFSLEEWMEIYNYILMLQIKSYKREEDIVKQKKHEDLDEALDAKAKELEDRLMQSLPQETVDVIIPSETANVVEDNLAELDVTGKVLDEDETFVVEQLAAIKDEILLERFHKLETKVYGFRKLGKISPTKEQTFRILHESISNGNTLDNLKMALTPSDYLRFLYYIFMIEFNKVKSDLETMYPVDEIDEFTQLLLEDISKPEEYIVYVEAEAQKQREEALVDEKTNEQEIISEEDSVNKLVFYGNGSPDILKDVKRFTSEKMSEVASLFAKIESGRIDKAMTINKNVPIIVKSLRGELTFVTFRRLCEGHILVISASNLDEFDSNINKLNGYDVALENRLRQIVKDGTLEYAKLMKQSAEVKATILKHGIAKGV